MVAIIYLLGRQRPGAAGVDDSALAEPDRRGPGRSAGDDPSVASRGLESFLALEIPKAGRAPEDRSWPA